MTIFLPTEPLSEDLIYDYRSYRWMGKGRDETIQLLLSDYADELEDVETRTFVMLGIAKALARKQEMTPAAASAAVTAIDDLIGLGYYRGAKAERVLETRRLLEKESIPARRPPTRQRNTMSRIGRLGIHLPIKFRTRWQNSTAYPAIMCCSGSTGFSGTALALLAFLPT